MHRAIVPFSEEHVRQALGLPPGSRIHAVRYSPETTDIEFVVEHPDLPHVSEGERAPFVRLGERSWQL